MDYFAFSPFWDPKSNNNVLRVQRRIEQPNYGHAEEKMYVLSSSLIRPPSGKKREEHEKDLDAKEEGQDGEEEAGLTTRELEAFNSGFEYIIAHAQPPQMFIIHRRGVGSGGRRDIVDAIYWILEGKIYPTPTLYDIMASRTVCLFPCLFPISHCPISLPYLTIPFSQLINAFQVPEKSGIG